MHLGSFGATHTGTVRRTNEDAYLVDNEAHLFAVADGMGGLPGGADVSQKAIEALREVAKENTLSAQAVLSAVQNANRKLSEEGQEAHPFIGWGTTLSMCKINEMHCDILHIGDSAIFLIRDCSIQKMTVDHTLEHDFIEEVGEGARAAMPDNYAHTLTRCLGQSPEMEIDQSSFELLIGDTILLCTDGLTKFVELDQISEAIHKSANPKKAVEALIHLANDAGGADNVTAVVISIT